MALMGKLKGAAVIAVAAVGFHAYQAGVAVTPAGHGGHAASAPAAPAARPGSNEALANRMAASMYGWRGGQAACLDALWTEESAGTWSATIANPTSRALGIPQALGHGTAGTAGRYGNEYGANYGLSTSEARAANNGDAASEVKWGLGYLHDRYGTPCAAWAFERSHTPNWY